MDIENDTRHYIIQTSEDNEDENELLLESNTIVVCSEDGEQTQYVPYAVENGQIILKRIDDDDAKRLENYELVEEVEKSPIKENNFNHENEKHDNNRIYSRPMQQRRKMSYETEFKPCSLPPNRGGMKGLIRYGRKHLIIDQQIMINPREFKSQLNSTEDLIMKSELAPCTKQHMRHMLTGITRLFAYPSHKMPNNKLLQLYVSNCTSRKQPNTEICSDMNLLPVGYKVEVDPTKIKRITRKRRYPEAEEYLRQQSLLQQEDAQTENDDMQQLVDAANTASTDHGYTNKTLELDHEYQDQEIKCEEQIYIMQSVDENGTQSNIEVLLAAAAETSDEEDLSGQIEQLHTVKEEGDEDQYHRIYIVQGTNEMICVPDEFNLP